MQPRLADLLIFDRVSVIVKAVARPPQSKGDTPCFLYVWQGKDLREGEIVCVAGKGVTGAICVCVAGKGVRDV